MYKVNLIRGWKNAEISRQLRNRIILLMAIIAGILLGIYLILFIRFVSLHKEFTELSNRQYVSKSGHQYSTEELTKALYGLKKLDQIKAIYLDYPEYALYHRFLLDKILQFNSYTIENYTLDRSHEVEVSLLTKELDDVFSLITLLESPKVSKYFTILEIDSISSVKEKKELTNSYKLQFKLQFNKLLLDEKI
jgi:hypothetical protein